MYICFVDSYCQVLQTGPDESGPGRRAAGHAGVPRQSVPHPVHRGRPGKCGDALTSCSATCGILRGIRPECTNCFHEDELQRIEGLVPGASSFTTEFFRSDGTHSTKAGPCVQSKGLSTSRGCAPSWTDVWPGRNWRRTRRRNRCKK